MKSTLLLGLLSGLSILPSIQANLIVNGDFEEPLVTDIGTGFTTYFGGQSFLGWTVSGDSVDVVGDNPTSWVSWNAASGHQSLDLNGNNVGAVSQQIFTVPGQTYDLSFALAANPVNTPSIATMEFLWQGQVVDTLAFVPQCNRANPGWTYVSYELTAPTDQAILTFGSLAPQGTAGAAIDDVVLNAVGGAACNSVPDSSSPWLAASMLLPFAFHWFTQRSQLKICNLNQQKPS